MAGKIEGVISNEEKLSLCNYNAMLKRNHMCVRCHKQDAFTLGGRSMCADCAAKQRERGAKFYARHKSEVCNKRKRKYAENKANKVCPRCGKRIIDNGKKVICYSCRVKDAIRKQNKNLSEGVNYPRGDNGLCWQCNKEKAIEGKKLCVKCFKVALRNLSIGRPSSNENHLWRRLNNNLYGGN